MCLSVYMPRAHGYPRRPEEGLQSYKARVAGGCELPYLSAGNQTQVPWKNSQCSWLLSLLSSPKWEKMFSISIHRIGFHYGVFKQK